MYKIVNLNNSELDVEGETLAFHESVYVKEFSEESMILMRAGLVSISEVVKAAEPVKIPNESKLASLVRNGHPKPFVDYSSNSHRLKQD